MKAKGKKASQKKTAAKTVALKASAAVAEKLAPPPPAPVATNEALALAEETLETQEIQPEVKSERRPVQTISEKERRRLIEVAAYHRAERHGFGQTNPVEDWLIAEQEIDDMLAHGITI